MQKRTCQWCGKPFYIKGGKDSHKTHCCKYCTQCDASDGYQYKKAITDPAEALIYIKKMIRRITGYRGCLWKALNMPQWDRLIKLHDSSNKTGEELRRAIAVVGKLLSMPAMKPLAKENPLWGDIEVVAKRKERKHYEKHVRS